MTCAQLSSCIVLTCVPFTSSFADRVRRHWLRFSNHSWTTPKAYNSMVLGHVDIYWATTVAWAKAMALLVKIVAVKGQPGIKGKKREHVGVDKDLTIRQRNVEDDARQGLSRSKSASGTIRG